MPDSPSPRVPLAEAPKVPVTAGTLRMMLANARRTNNVEAWIAVALEWADEAERIALSMADELTSLRRPSGGGGE